MTKRTEPWGVSEGATKRYWFAYFRQLTSEDFGIKPSKIATQNLVRDRFLPVSFAWRFRLARPVALEGWLVILGAIVAMAAGGVVAAVVGNTVEAPDLALLALLGWLGLVCIVFFVVLDRTSDPDKAAEDYKSGQEHGDSVARKGEDA
jgi:hypothetical protein